jgi:hypothetical protein
MKRKDSRIYKHKIKPILDNAVKKAFESVENESLISINKEEQSFTEILNEETIWKLKISNNYFRHKIINFNKKHPQFDVSPYFFLRALAHFKILYVIKNLYLKEYTNSILLDNELKNIIEKIVIEKTPSEEDALIGYFNIHETVNEILIKIKNNRFNFKADIES